MAVVVDPLTGTDREAPEILDECREKMLSEGWDLALCLTDLPVYRGGRLVAADVSSERGVGEPRCPPWARCGCVGGPEKPPSGSPKSSTRRCMSPKRMPPSSDLHAPPVSWAPSGGSIPRTRTWRRWTSTPASPPRGRSGA